MTDYINYTANNATNMTGILQYTADVFETGAGADVFFPFFLVCLFMGAAIISSRYGAEKSITFSAAFTFLNAVMLTSAGLLTPIWLVLALIVLGIAIFMEG